MRKALLWIAGLLGLLVLAVVLIGFALPVAHVESRTATFAVPPEQVFPVLTTVEEFPRWRRGVESVEVLAQEPHLRWREVGDDTLTFERVESRAPSRLVTRIADPDLPFGGTWTYDLSPHDAGTQLTITEHGEVYNPVFRFMSRFVFGHAATIEGFLEDLGHRLGAS